MMNTLSLSQTVDSARRERRSEEPESRALGDKTIVRRRVLILFACLFVVVAVTSVVALIVSSSSGTVETSSFRSEVEEDSSTLTVGEYVICDWEKVDIDTHVPIFIDGEMDSFYESEEDTLIRGVLCGTDQSVTLALDDTGLHGSFLVSDVEEVFVEPIDSGLSHMRTVPAETHFEADDEQHELDPEYLKFREFLESQTQLPDRRRNLNRLQPGSVDIHLHLDIDSYMVSDYGSPYAAARYGVELIAIINRDAFFPLGFNLKVVSINTRTSPLSANGNPSSYLNALRRTTPRPNNVNLVHSLSTRGLGGGVAWLDGLYSSRACYAVSGINGGFAFWDKVVVAHELGHNFGSPHTHDYSPQIDTCGSFCVAGRRNHPNPDGTIMSYCHICNGGLGNIRYEWASRVEDLIWDRHARFSHLLATRFQCQSMTSGTPDTSVPFYLTGDECLSIDTSNCGSACAINTCTDDAIWAFDGTRIHSAKDSNYCWSATSGCNAISLETCSSSQSQRFSFSAGRLRSNACGAVKFSGSAMGFSGSEVNVWCLPGENNGGSGPQCDFTEINLSCGQVHTGSTRSDCNAERRFKFSATGDSVTISTCRSEYDTTLRVQRGNTVIRSGDDEGNCGHQTVLSDIPTSSGEEYTIVLSGYEGQTGTYRIQLTCNGDNSDSSDCEDDDCDACIRDLSDAYASNGWSLQDFQSDYAEICDDSRVAVEDCMELVRDSSAIFPVIQERFQSSPPDNIRNVFATCPTSSICNWSMSNKCMSSDCNRENAMLMFDNGDTTFSMGYADFGVFAPVSGQLVLSEPSDGCSAFTNSPAVRGNIAVVMRGGCFFSDKARVAQQAGAIALLILNNQNTDVNSMICGSGIEGCNDINIASFILPDAATSTVQNKLTNDPDHTFSIGCTFNDGSQDTDFFTMTGDCEIVNDCVQTRNYPGRHTNNERCEVTMLRDSAVQVGTIFGVETCCDQLVIQGKDVEQSRDVPPVLLSGETFTWSTDFSVAREGWQLCFSEIDGTTRSPTLDPTMDPTSDPSMDPTSDPTMDPTLDPTLDPTSEPTVDSGLDPNKCLPWCANSGQPWATKCTFGDCEGCGDCASRPAGTCRSWCATSGQPWATKCTFDDCEGCDDCASSPAGTCLPWCATSVQPWATKCTFDDCGGCGDCTSCQTWCAASSQPWSAKCGFDDCVGCQPCREP